MVFLCGALWPVLFVVVCWVAITYHIKMLYVHSLMCYKHDLEAGVSEEHASKEVVETLKNINKAY